MIKLIDTLSYNNKLRSVSPMWKSGFAAALFLLAYMAHPPVQLLIFGWVTIWTVGHAGIPLKYFLMFVAMSSLFFAASLPGLVVEFAQGSLLISSSGVHLALLLWVRITACVSCMFFLVLTVPVSELLQLLRKLRVPALVIEIMIITYRFLFLFTDTANDMFVAQRARGGHIGLKNRLRDTSLLIARLFVKTMQRYKGLSNGLISRGFTEEIQLPPYKGKHVGGKYWLESAAGILILLVVEGLIRWKGGWR